MMHQMLSYLLFIIVYQTDIIYMKCYFILVSTVNDHSILEFIHLSPVNVSRLVYLLTRWRSSRFINMMMPVCRGCFCSSVVWIIIIVILNCSCYFQSVVVVGSSYNYLCPYCCYVCSYCCYACSYCCYCYDGEVQVMRISRYDYVYYCYLNYFTCS